VVLLPPFPKRNPVWQKDGRGMAKYWQKLGTAKNKFCDNIITSLKNAHFSGVRFFVCRAERRDENDIENNRKNKTKRIIIQGCKLIMNGMGYQELRENNARAKQSQRQYEYLNNSEFKYLVDDKKAREKFINTLLSEVKNIQNTEQFGYLQPDVNKKYKEEAIRAIMRIVYLNQNYDKYSAERDAELRKLLRNK